MTTAPAAPQTIRAWVEQIMGLPVSLHIRARDTHRPDIAAGVSRAYEHLRRVDQVFSTWSQDSDVMRLRRGRLRLDEAHPWIGQVSVLCAEATRETHGLFTTDLAGPDGTRGWDPTGLVKGWAVREATRPLRELPGVQFCINAGGDLTCGAGRDSADLDAIWRVGVENPANPQLLSTVVPVTNGALATSGTGARGAHIVDPRLGYPVSSSLSSITIAGPDLMWADVWATASFIDPEILAHQTDRRWAGYHVVNRTHHAVR